MLLNKGSVYNIIPVRVLVTAVVVSRVGLGGPYIRNLHPPKCTQHSSSRRALESQLPRAGSREFTVTQTYYMHIWRRRQKPRLECYLQQSTEYQVYDIPEYLVLRSIMPVLLL